MLLRNAPRMGNTAGKTVFSEGELLLSSGARELGAPISIDILVSRFRLSVNVTGITLSSDGGGK